MGYTAESALYCLPTKSNTNWHFSLLFCIGTFQVLLNHMQDPVCQIKAMNISYPTYGTLKRETLIDDLKGKNSKHTKTVLFFFFFFFFFFTFNRELLQSIKNMRRDARIYFLPFSQKLELGSQIY